LGGGGSSFNVVGRGGRSDDGGASIRRVIRREKVSVGVNRGGVGDWKGGAAALRGKK